MRVIPSGFTSHHGVLVTQAMTVDFEVEDDDKLGALHPVYATYWLAKHMELVSRKIILPYLEDDE
ncbi:MAG TPA: thioesterase, partial [Trueperaceae bacterium]|nr:thioesterase [Trueperaceae bacterium]